MSSRCQCRFSGPADTILGSHRDPIASEKSWLDFAVRELSRVAAGKARGQEAVWRVQCKPTWWDAKCPDLAWKNPTANPKDTKDTLKMKFECLVQHLRQEYKIPGEMEEEIRLWEAGRISEVFLMTTFSSIIGQVSSVHTMLLDARQKMAETGIGIHSSIPDDINKCLNACLKELETIHKMSSKKDGKDDQEVPVQACNTSLKRGRDEQDTGDATPPAKQARVSSPTISSSSSSSPSSAFGSLSDDTIVVNGDNSPPGDSLSNGDFETQKLMAALQHKILLKKSEVAAGQQRQSVLTAQKRTIAPAPARVKVEARKCLAPATASAAASVLIAPCGPAAVTVTDPTPQYIPGDFLDLDYLEEPTITDFKFLDNLLTENSLVLVDNTPKQLSSNSPSFTADPQVEMTNPESKAEVETTHVTTPVTRLARSAFPTAAENSAETSQSLLPVTVAGRSWSLEDDIVSLEGIGSDACLGVGNETPDRDLSDAGYSSESSSPPHRNSTDSFDENIEVNSPDFEALLDSLEF